MKLYGIHELIENKRSFFRIFLTENYPFQVHREFFTKEISVKE